MRILPTPLRRRQPPAPRAPYIYCYHFVDTPRWPWCALAFTSRSRCALCLRQNAIGGLYTPAAHNRVAPACHRRRPRHLLEPYSQKKIMCIWPTLPRHRRPSRDSTRGCSARILSLVASGGQDESRRDMATRCRCTICTNLLETYIPHVSIPMGILLAPSKSLRPR